ARCKRLVKNLTEQLPPGSDTEPATIALYDAWQKARDRLGERPEMPAVVAALRGLEAPINRFFDDVMVMVDDAALREARLALVQRIAALPDGVADLSKLQGY